MSKKLISKNMTFSEILQKFPSTVPILLKYGLHCVGCHVAAMETIEQGALAHGLNEEQIKELIEELNKEAEKTQSK